MNCALFIVFANDKTINILDSLETTGFKTSGRNRHERFDVMSFQRGDDRYQYGRTKNPKNTSRDSRRPQ